LINFKKYNLALSIKQSILLLILLPSFLITTILTTYLIISRQSDAQNELLLQANSAINYISSSSELALFIQLIRFTMLKKNLSGFFKHLSITLK